METKIKFLLISRMHRKMQICKVVCKELNNLCQMLIINQLMKNQIKAWAVVE